VQKNGFKGNYSHVLSMKNCSQAPKVFKQCSTLRHAVRPLVVDQGDSVE